MRKPKYVYPMALCGLGFGEAGFLVEASTIDPTMEEMGIAMESTVLICVPSYGSCSLGGELVQCHHLWVLAELEWVCFISRM